MKKILFFASALAGLFFAASCQQEELAPMAENGVVTFEVGIPEVATKAYADDGTNIDDLVYAVYRTSKDNLAEALSNDDLHPVYQKNYSSKVVFNNGSTTIPIELINNQNYLIVFWAQVNDAWVKGNEFDPFEVKYPTEMDANDQRLEAFSGTSFITNVTGGRNEKVILRRPFAQINLATKLPQTFKATISESSMAVVGAPVSFNAIEQIASTDVTTTAKPLNFKNAVIPGGNFKEGYAYAGANYIFAGEKNTVSVSYTITTSHGVVNNSVPSVPVAKNYRTNIIGNLLTSTADYNVEIEAGFTGSVDRDPYTTYVTNDEELTAALAQNIKDIVIDLAQVETKASTPKTYNINVGANTPTYYFGGEETRTITIKANGNTVNFVHNNSDWNYIRCVSDDAKWIIYDANLTNSGENDGPWNRHDIRFYNAVELNNVTSDKAIALLNDGKFNNVQISDVHPTDSEAYGLWITAQGQTVSLDGVTITPAEGKTTDRAIKIDKQYIDSPAKVTLSVSNSKFVSQKKAAITVASPAGAIINWGTNNDIKGVVADPINAVWIDEDYADYASEVEVEGTSKVIEGAVGNVAASTQETLNEVLADAKGVETTVVVNLAEGTYTFPGSKLSENVVLNCAEGTVFEGSSKANINGATVIGATFSSPSGSAITGSVNGTFRDCVFEGVNGLRDCYAGETVVFENCVFTGSTYGAHFDGGANDIIFKNCTFSGFNAFPAAVTMITFDGCKFVANGKSGYNGANLWGSTKMINTEFTFDGTATTEWVDIRGSSEMAYTFNGCTVCGKPMPIETIGVFTFNDTNDEVDITFNGVEYKNYKTSTFISTAEELFAFANEVNVNNNAFNGKTVYLMADIDLDNAAWTPVGQTGATQFKGTFDGQGKTISNLNIDATAQTGANCSSGLFGWLNAATVKNVNITDATVKGNHNVGVIAGYLETSGCTIEACHVTRAAVECHVANNDANGDKCGVIVGHAGNAGVVVKNCKAADSTVSAGRDAGQIAGAAKEANVIGCSATNVTVTANGEGTGANVRNEVIGRLL